MASNLLPPARGDDAQDEERLEAALEHMKELHLRLRGLRSALPRMLEPLFAKQSSPALMYKSFLESVQSTRKEIDDFRQAIGSDETKKIFTQVSESRRANPRGIYPWRPRDDPEWTTLKRTERDDPTDNPKETGPNKRIRMEGSG